MNLELTKKVILLTGGAKRNDAGITRMHGLIIIIPARNLRPI